MLFKAVKFSSPRISTGKICAKMYVETKVGIKFWDYIWKLVTSNRKKFRAFWFGVEISFIPSNHMRKLFIFIISSFEASFSLRLNCPLPHKFHIYVRQTFSRTILYDFDCTTSEKTWKRVNI